MNLLIRILSRAALLALPVGFSVLIILSLVSGDFKECLILFLTILNYNFLFIVILIKLKRSDEEAVSNLRTNNMDRNAASGWVRCRMNIILAVIVFNMMTISYVIVLNLYAVMLIFFGDSLFNSFCTLNCMSDPKSAKQVILFNIIFLLSDVTWVLRAEIYFLNQFEIHLNPEMYFSEEAQQLAMFNDTMEERLVNMSLMSENFTSKLSMRDSTCHICLSEIDNTDRIILLRCSHGFHADCIRDWVKIRRTCPSCRCAVTSNRREYQSSSISMPIVGVQVQEPVAIELEDIS